jgi:hypothetical protein
LPVRWPARSAWPPTPAPAHHGPLFIGLLIGVVVLVGVLNYVPALALGPVVEHLQLFANKESHVTSTQKR